MESTSDSFIWSYLVMSFINLLLFFTQSLFHFHFLHFISCLILNFFGNECYDYNIKPVIFKCVTWNLAWQKIWIFHRWYGLILNTGDIGVRFLLFWRWYKLSICLLIWNWVWHWVLYTDLWKNILAWFISLVWNLTFFLYKR